MITLSLDEYGDFENVKKENGPVFIGGTLFDDKGVEGEANTERKRIDAYYGEVFKEASEQLGRELVYPYDLHADSFVSKAEKQTKKFKEKIIKTIVTETLGEFLKEGTFRGREPEYFNGNQVKALPKRQGKYYLYTILRSEKGKETRLSTDVGIYRKDDYASNLYFHMASEVINRVVFQNPLVQKESEFNLLIATRSSGNIERGSELDRQYKKLGYECTKRIRDKEGNMVDLTLDNGKLAAYYQLTNIDIYRTIVDQYLMGRNENDISVGGVKSESIDYKTSDKSQQMLYLADSVCSILSFQLKSNERNTADEWLKEMAVRGSRLVSSENYLLFAYDSIDVDFSEALDAYNVGDYCKALKVIYNAREKKGEFVRFYSDTWFSYLERKMEASGDVAAFTRLVNVFYDSQLAHGFNQEQGIYIISELEKMAEIMKGVITTPERQDIFFKLYLSAMISYCHVGNSAEAEAYYFKARKYAFSVSSEEWIRARNSLTVCYCDCFEWDKALKIAEENTEYANLTVALKKQIDDQLSLENTLLSGKTYSQLGQVYGFLKDEKAETAFRKALMLLPEKSPNYYLSESYLLHYYLSSGNQKKYEDYAFEFFGGHRSLEEQLEYLESMKMYKNPLISYEFGLYVYLKSLAKFYINSISDSLWNSLCLISDVKGHPGEIIYRYLCLIALDKKDKFAFESFLNKLTNCERIQGALLNAIQELSFYEVFKQNGENDKAESHFNNALTVLADSYKVFSNIQSKALEEKEELINNYITYMYR